MLGTILPFYINDLPNIFANSRTILFADNSTLYITDSDPAGMIHTVNIDVDNFDKWLNIMEQTGSSSKQDML